MVAKTSRRMTGSQTAARVRRTLGKVPSADGAARAPRTEHDPTPLPDRVRCFGAVRKCGRGGRRRAGTGRELSRGEARTAGIGSYSTDRIAEGQTRNENFSEPE